MPAKKTSREAIIVNALQVFRKQGYHHTSIADLSVACGIQKAHFYYYFENKAGLMQEILDTVNQYFEHKVLTYAYDEDLSPAERVEKLCAKLYRALSSEQGGCIMANTALEVARLDHAPAFLNQIKLFFDRMVAAFTHIFGYQFDENDATDYAEQVIQDLEGGLILMQVHKDEKYFVQALRRAHSILST